MKGFYGVGGRCIHTKLIIHKRLPRKEHKFKEAEEILYVGQKTPEYLIPNATHPAFRLHSRAAAKISHKKRLTPCLRYLEGPKDELAEQAITPEPKPPADKAAQARRRADTFRAIRTGPMTQWERERMLRVWRV